MTKLSQPIYQGLACNRYFGLGMTPRSMLLSYQFVYSSSPSLIEQISIAFRKFLATLSPSGVCTNSV